MAGAATYLLDTNILLHWIRGGKIAENIDGQFQLRTSGFRPLICEVTLGEMEAFARDNKWKEARRAKLRELKKELIAVDISDYRLVEAYADLSTLARSKGWAIFHDKNDLWIAAATRVTGSTLLTMDRSAFGPLRNAGELDVIILDPKTGYRE
jgi:predicted nucleic acid-binding protein